MILYGRTAALDLHHQGCRLSFQDMSRSITPPLSFSDNADIRLADNKSAWQTSLINIEKGTLALLLTLYRGCDAVILKINPRPSRVTNIHH